jgi:hypothetical protein
MRAFDSAFALTPRKSLSRNCKAKLAVDFLFRFNKRHPKLFGHTAEQVSGDFFIGLPGFLSSALFRA